MIRKLLATAVLVALVAGAFIAGKATQGSKAASSSTSSTTPGRVTKPTTAASTTSTTEAGPARCAGAKIQTTIPSSAGAAGTIEATIRGVNLGSTTCSMRGYPKVQLQASVGGAGMATTVVQGGSFSKAAAAGSPTIVTVAPGASFEFQMTYSNVPVGTATSCPSSSGLGITWPSAGATASLPYTATVCGGGVVHVSRVFAG